ncbi:MAG TPA: signal peptidase II [Candidatus Babeliales bacterium]|nr:signal peptidase II [Candidatus Babeliales bacterium]
MRQLAAGFWYSLLFLSIFLADRITKACALDITSSIPITKYIFLELIFNRGVSWGMFHSSNDLTFLMVSILIALIILGIGIYTVIRWMNNYNIVGEVMIIAGALSNMIDRIVYHGVIDFILISNGSWSFPVFNIADAAIVSGVFIMFIMSFNEV